jgi:hypothetical protein|tara:strand:+ start:190 stop:303 length:114 start_codon:yes stop_codon:yes gene_type:complete
VLALADKRLLTAVLAPLFMTMLRVRDVPLAKQHDTGA